MAIPQVMVRINDGQLGLNDGFAVRGTPSRIIRRSMHDNRRAIWIRGGA
jgi:hypothetical protein